MFTDETEHVIGRVMRSSNRSRCSVRQLNPTQRVLSISIEDQASCFFLRNYVWEDSDSNRGHLDHVYGFIKASGNETLVAALTSVGMAGLANVKNDPCVMAAAREKYAAALQLTNLALQDPGSVWTDQTLTSVLLLGIFEVQSLPIRDICIPLTSNRHSDVDL